MLAAQADGAEVTTIEGLSGSDGELHPLQDAFWEKHGLQCGFCTPGMIMAAADLLERNPNPTDEEIRHGLEGNLCRCTGYHNIVEAVKAAAGTGGDGMTRPIGHAHEAQGGPAHDHRPGPLHRGHQPPGDAPRGRSCARRRRTPRSPRSTPPPRRRAPAWSPCFTGEDLAGDFAGPLPMVWAPPGVEIKTPSTGRSRAARSSTSATRSPSSSPRAGTRRSTPPRT